MAQKNLDVSMFKPKTAIPQYNPNPDDQTKIEYINKRFMEMQQARITVDKNWTLFQRMILARYIGYEDERSSSVVPLIWAMTELYIAQAMKIPVDFEFKSDDIKDATNAKALEHVWNYDRKKNNREKTFNEAEYIACMFGTAIFYTGYECYEKTQWDFKVDDEKGYIWTENSFKDEKILVENVDIRDFYIDNQAITCIEQANDCFLRVRISYENFQNFKNSPLYKNTEYVAPCEYSNEYRTFYTNEDVVKQGEFVELRKYRNIEKDCFMVSANGVLIREQHMVSTMDGKKALPFTVRILGKQNYSIYGRGLCEASMMFNSELNNLREMLMDAVKRSNQSVLAIGNGLSFNGRTFSFDNQILAFDGALNDSSFQQISGTPPNQAIFEQMDRIYKDIAIFCGIDIQNIVGEPQQTAFQTDVQREASQSRINVWLRNRDLAMERFACLHKDNLQIYFPRKDADNLYPKIQIQDQELIGGKEDPKFVKKKGPSMFEVTPEILRGSIYIDVHTDTTMNSTTAVKKQQAIEMAPALSSLVTMYANAKAAGIDLESILPPKQFLQDFVDDFDIETPDPNDDMATQKAMANLMDTLQKARPQLPGQTPPGQSGQAPQQTPGQPQAPSAPVPGQTLPSQSQPGQVPQ